MATEIALMIWCYGGPLDGRNIPYQGEVFLLPQEQHEVRIIARTGYQLQDNWTDRPYYAFGYERQD